jgi:hypothetical protein
MKAAGERHLPCFTTVVESVVPDDYFYVVVFLLFPVRYCDPLGGDNIWSTLYPRLKAEQMNRTVVVVAARLDGTSMFDGLVPGAMSPVSGIVTLLMTAKAVASIAQNLSNIDSHQGE